MLADDFTRPMRMLRSLCSSANGTVSLRSSAFLLGLSSRKIFLNGAPSNQRSLCHFRMDASSIHSKVHSPARALATSQVRDFCWTFKGSIQPALLHVLSWDHDGLVRKVSAALSEGSGSKSAFLELLYLSWGYCVLELAATTGPSCGRSRRRFRLDGKAATHGVGIEDISRMTWPS